MTATNLLNVPPASARELVGRWTSGRGLPGYRTGQIVRRLWQAPVGAWVEATELPLTLRAELEEAFPLCRLTAEVEQQSADGTRKYLWRLPDGEAIESVLIPSGGRRTLCISSQAGCALGCTFCATGRWDSDGTCRCSRSPGRSGRSWSGIRPTPDEHRVHGDGRAAPQLARGRCGAHHPESPEGFGIGARHITVSTVGILPGLEAFARRPEQFRLAISLHAPSSPQRLGIMPIEKKYDLAQVLKAAAAFRSVSRSSTS